MIERSPRRRSSPCIWNASVAGGRRTGRKTGGFTILDTLIALAIVASLVAGTTVALKPSRARLDAEGYAMQLRSARLSAIGARPIAIVWRSDLGRFERIEGDDRCARGPQATWRPSPGTAVTHSVAGGVVWLPDGTGRNCGGGGVYGGRIRFVDRRGVTWDVIVASSGRVRTERVP